MFLIMLELQTVYGLSDIHFSYNQYFPLSLQLAFLPVVEKVFKNVTDESIKLKLSWIWILKKARRKNLT